MSVTPSAVGWSSSCSSSTRTGEIHTWKSDDAAGAGRTPTPGSQTTPLAQAAGRTMAGMQPIWIWTQAAIVVCVLTAMVIAIVKLS
jgi:hypothetical protein